MIIGWGARSPRLLFADRSGNLYPADIAVAEDIRGGTMEALLARDPDAGRQTLAQLAEMLRRMHDYRAPAFGRGPLAAPTTSGPTADKARPS